MLGAALLARTWRHTRRTEYLALSDAAMKYSCTRQLADRAWWYGEAQKYHWIDNFHTGYNLDSLKCYVENTGNKKYSQCLKRGFEYYANTFFEASGRPRYYHNRAQPIDIQCASQPIETLTKFSPDHDSALLLALRVAKWTIENMQDAAGYFYYRRYPLITAKAPMLHWGLGDDVSRSLTPAAEIRRGDAPVDRGRHRHDAKDRSCVVLQIHGYMSA
jgi:hypothetical protein